jgi:hypothetical protein
MEKGIPDQCTHELSLVSNKANKKKKKVEDVIVTPIMPPRYHSKLKSCSSDLSVNPDSS